MIIVLSDPIPSYWIYLIKTYLFRRNYRYISTQSCCYYCMITGSVFVENIAVVRQPQPAMEACLNRTKPCLNGANATCMGKKHTQLRSIMSCLQKYSINCQVTVDPSNTETWIFRAKQINAISANALAPILIHGTVKPVYNDHLMGYFSAFWSSSRWPRAT